MLKKEIHFFDFDTRHFICVNCHLESDEIDVYKFLKWIYSLKLDASLSSNKILGQGITTKDLNDTIKGILHHDTSFVDLGSFYKLLDNGDVIESNIVTTITSKLLNFFVVDNIRVFSRVEYNDMLVRTFDAESQDRVLNAVPYNTRVLSAVDYDPFVEKVEQDILKDKAKIIEVDETTKIPEIREIPKIYRLANNM